MQADYNAVALGISGIQNYWALADGSGTSFVDSQGSATLSAGTTVGTLTGPDGVATAAAIANTTNKVLTASSFSWPEDWSVAFWVNCNSTASGDAMAFEWNQSSFAKYVHLDMGPTGTLATADLYYGTGGGTTWSLNKSTFSTAAWKFVVVTYTRSTDTFEFYVDNTSAGSHTTSGAQASGAPGSGYLGIGGRNNAGTRGLPFDGSLCGFALYNVVLTSQNRSDLYNAMLAVATPKSASDTVTATEGSGSVNMTTGATTSDTVTATDTAGVQVAIPYSTAPGTAQFGDTMTGTDATALTSHTPTGSNAATGPWVVHPGYTIAPYIYSNRAQATSADTSAAAATLSDSPASADYFVAADITVVSAYGLGGILARHSPSVLTGYAAVINGANGDLELHCWNAGSYVGKIASYAAGVGVGSTVAIVAGFVGSRITVDLNGTRRIDITDTTVSAANKVGVRTTRNVGTSTGIAVDNLVVYTAATATGADSATATESASVGLPITSVSASDSATGTDSSATTVYVGGALATPSGSSLAGSTTTLRDALSATDSLLHNAFPGACRLPNGNHLVAYQHANTHAATTAKVEYQIINPSTLAVVSGPTVIRTGAAGTNIADISCWRDGATVYMLWNESTTPGTSNINTVVGVYLISSSDNGATWTSPTAISIGFDTNGAGVAGAYGIAANPVRVKSNGDWLLPVYGYNDKTTLASGYVKIRKSTDKGATWTTLATLTVPGGGSFDETDLLILDSGRILCVLRTFPSIGGTHFYGCTSDDGGATWTTPSLIIMNAGGRPALHQTSTGTVLLTYRYMVSGTTSAYTHLVTSTDRGATWGSAVDPYDGAAGRTSTTGMSSTPPRGVGVYGAFAEASASSTDAVLYWCEEGLGDATKGALFARQVTTTGTTGGGVDSAAGTDAGGVTVGAGGATAYITASDSLAGSDSSSLATTILTVSVTATDSATTVESTQYTAPSSDTPTAATPERRRRAYRYRRRGGEW